jgi:chromosome segregation ATPase
MADAPEAVQEMHEATHRRLFQNDVSRKVDEKLKQDKNLEERSWRAAEAEVADLAATMDEIASEMTRDKEREGELRTKVREMTRAQDRIERRTSELTRSMTMVKLSGQDGAGRVAKLEDGLAELVLEHDAQAKDITAAEARLEVLRSHVGDGTYNIESGPSVLQGLDKDATLAHGIERKHQVMRTRKRALGKAVVDVEKILNEQTERHSELTSQLAVAEMTLKAMKSVLAQGR